MIVCICTGGEHEQMNWLDNHISTIEIMIVFETSTPDDNEMLCLNQLSTLFGLICEYKCLFLKNMTKNTLFSVHNLLFKTPISILGH